MRPVKAGTAHPHGVLALVGAHVEEQVDPFAGEQACPLQVLGFGRGLGVVWVQLVAKPPQAALNALVEGRA